MITPQEIAERTALRAQRKRYRDQTRDDRTKNPVAVKLMRSSRTAAHSPSEVLFRDRDRRAAAPETPNTTILGDPTTPRWASNADH